jgi:ribonuclease BN (tRNA processing enzyme)
MVDAGGGVFLRFGEAGAQVRQLDLIAISHLHPDHVSDLPALLWLTGSRASPLRIVGPSGDELFPDFGVFLERLVGGRDSAFPILSKRFNRGQGGAVSLEPTTIDVTRREPTAIPLHSRLQVSAIGVPHTAPSLAYRFSLKTLARSVAEVQSRYPGPITVAEDLVCLALQK